MSLDFAKLASAQTGEKETVAEATESIFKMDLSGAENLPSVVENQEIVIDNSYKLALREKPEVKALLSEVNVGSMESILAFGQSPTDAIGRVSDDIMQNMQPVTITEATQMMNTLMKAMEKFELKDFETPNAPRKGIMGYVDRLFNKSVATVDSLLKKYDTMGKEVGDIQVQLKGYETSIRKTNHDLERQYKATLQYIALLEQYIVAGEMALEDMDNFREKLEKDETLSDNERELQLQRLEQAKDAFSQRLYDLQLSEAVAMQSCPLILNIASSNFNLLRKINSSISTTLPIFKNSLIQAVQLKRQEVQAKSIAELDRKTNEMLLKNAQRSAEQSKDIAKLSRGSAVDIETLRTSFETIRLGIEESKRIAEEESAKRDKNRLELEAMKQKMKKEAISGNF